MNLDGTFNIENFLRGCLYEPTRFSELIKNLPEDEPIFTRYLSKLIKVNKDRPWKNLCCVL